MPRLVDHIRAAAFDLDGTLIDTAPDLAAAANAMLSELGYRQFPDARFESLIGDGIDALTARAVAESSASPVDSATLANAIRLTRQHYAAHLFERGRVYSGVTEGLRALAASGIGLGVVTNKASAFTKPLLAAAGLGDRFPLALCADRPEDCKPSPNLLFAACLHFGVQPQELVYVGDSITDVRAARAAGCWIVLVDYGYNDGQLAEANPDAVVASLAEIAALTIPLHRPGKIE